jgi:hypothetical protein
MCKEAIMERTCQLQERTAKYQLKFDQPLQIEGFDAMPVFLQAERYLPAPGGAEAMLYTVTLPDGHPMIATLTEAAGPDADPVNKVIMVGGAFLAQSHTRKLILLQAESCRQKKGLTDHQARPAEIAETNLDREIAVRQSLAWTFRPEQIRRTLSRRDRVVCRSTTRVSQGIYAGSDDHYKAPFPGKRAGRCRAAGPAEEPDLNITEETEEA